MPSTDEWEILLVEDNPADVTLFEMAFPTCTKIHLSHAADGRKALDFLYRVGQHVKAPRPQLIFLDLNLPRVDGREVLETIKADADLKRIPVIMLSTSHTMADVEDCYQRGANSYLVKPADLNALFEMMHNCCKYWFETVVLKC